MDAGGSDDAEGDAVAVVGGDQILGRGVGRRLVPGRLGQRLVAQPEMEMGVDARRFRQSLPPLVAALTPGGQ